VAYATRLPAGLHDPSVYLSAGDQISRGLGYRYIDGVGPTAYFPPGFPYALGAVFWLVRHTPLPDDLPHAATTLNAVASRAAVGLASLTRPPALLFLVALGIGAWVGGAGWRRALAQAGIALLAAAVVIVPWSIRNAVVMDAPIAISTNLGDDLCIGHNPAAT